LGVGVSDLNGPVVLALQNLPAFLILLQSQIEAKRTAVMNLEFISVCTLKKVA